MTEVPGFLSSLSFPVLLSGISALEIYYGKRPSGVYQGITTASLVTVAREHENTSFPSNEYADILLKSDQIDIDTTEQAAGYSNCGYELALQCVDSFSRELYARDDASLLLNSCFYFDVQRKVFMDPCGLYPLLRNRIIEDLELTSVDQVMKLALLVSRLEFRLGSTLRRKLKSMLKSFQGSAAWQDVSALHQRHLLTGLLAGSAPQLGLIILKDSGFLAALWPELVEMVYTHHSKEYHPEGDVWDHTLEALKYRKTRDLRLSLSLLLHDVGKPRAGKESGNAFHRHAQIGAAIGRKFLRRLEFDEQLVQDVFFLIEQHMLPPFVACLPVSRTGQAMSSPLFPLLLELYRCDLSSSFRALDDYYAACKAYRAYLRNSRNPFRSSGGKKLLRLYLEALTP